MKTSNRIVKYESWVIKSNTASDPIVNTVIYWSHPYVNKDGYPAKCNSAVIYLTYSTFHLQYLGETAQQINLKSGKQGLF